MVLSTDWPLTTAHRLRAAAAQVAAHGTELVQGNAHEPRGFGHDVLVADAVVSVLADPHVPTDRVGNGIGLRVRGDRAMKGRVGDDDLRQAGKHLAAGLDRGDRRRVVDRRQVLVGQQLGQHGVVDQRMIGDRRTAVDESMADHVGHGAGRFAQRTHHFLQRLGMVPHGHHASLLAGCASMQHQARRLGRGRANALRFAARQFLFAGHGDQPVLERRTAAVEDEDVHGQISSTVQPHTGMPTRL